MSKETIWQFLKHKGFSSEAAAAILGNMEAESNCVSCRLQGDFTKGFARFVAYAELAETLSGMIMAGATVIAYIYRQRGVDRR